LGIDTTGRSAEWGYYTAHTKGACILDRLGTVTLRRFSRHKARRRELLEPHAPLFCSWPGRRISKRRVVRHANPMTTVVYTHPSDEELREGVRNLAC